MFQEIDNLRKSKGISQKALCERAGIHETTYFRLKAGHSQGNGKTLHDLRNALDELVSERGGAHA